MNTMWAGAMTKVFSSFITRIHVLPSTCGTVHPVMLLATSDQVYYIENVEQSAVLYSVDVQRNAAPISLCIPLISALSRPECILA
jgi:hypothetical protein